MAEKSKEAKARLKIGESLDFHYQKSPEYRTIHCDGALGGPTPRGYLSVTFFNERGTIPRRSSREVVEVGDAGYRLGDEKIVDSLDGVMRQLETTVFMDLNATREFFVWLGQRLWALEESLGLPENERMGTRPSADSDG